MISVQWIELPLAVLGVLFIFGLVCLAVRNK
jgi:hypothetical protein